MYNRYVPQSDGSFQRCRVEDTLNRPEVPRKDPPANHPQQPPCPPPPPKQSQQRRHSSNPPPYARQDKRSEPRDGNVLHFLRNLLPRDFDTGDLLVVILLLLLSADCQDDQNTALLTLALYLFM